MTNEAIAAIKQAETRAEVLCRVAEERAAEMRLRVETEGKAHCDQVEAEALSQHAATMESIRSRAEALSARKCAEAVRDAEALAEDARTRIPEAVQMIVWGIVEKCL